jgi:hypothetical protein
VRSLRHRRSAVKVIAVGAAILGLCAAPAHGAGTQPLTQKEVHYWTAVATCETGEGGPPKWDWGTKHRPGEGTLYQGGLGISALMWTEWAGELGLLTRFPHAFNAPPHVQMEVAQYGVSVHHAVWGCKG